MATALVWTSSSELGSLVGDKFTAASPDSCNGTFPNDADPFFWGESAEKVYSLLSEWFRWCSNTTMLHGMALVAEVVSYEFELPDSRDALS